MNALVRLYVRHAGLTTVVLSAVALAVVWSAPLLGGAVAPYDFQTADFPPFIDSVRAAKFNPFCIYNPFNDAGQLTSNLFAYFDPLAWIAVAAPDLPGYDGLQLYFFAHLLLIPTGLVLVAWANDVPRERWWAIVPISTVAFAFGPTLKYLEHTNSLVALGCLVFLFGALEAFRRSGALWAALAAGLAAAYTMEHWIYAAIFIPIPIAAYALVNWRAMFGTRRRFAYIVAAAVVAIAVALPSALLDIKVNQTIEISRNLQQLSELSSSDALSMVGAPRNVVPLIGIPAALIALVLVAFRHATPVERRVYGATAIVLGLYGFAEVTPFAALFRHVYAPAGFIRRPYAAWYVLIPMLLFLATRALATWSRFTVQASTLLSGAAVAIAVSQGTPWFPAAIVGTTLALTFWRPVLPLVMAAMLVQWAVIDWQPFQASDWRPQPIEPRLTYFKPYETLRPILPFESSRSMQAYRVANIGLPAEFGPSAGAFAVYDVVADYNTVFPRELVRELGTDMVHATTLPKYFESHPDALGGAPWRRLAVRYYLFSPEVFAALRPAFARHGLRVVVLPSYWRVVEDPQAAPFVSAQLDDGRTAAIDAAMTRDSFALVLPVRARTIRFAQNYDPWWHAYAADGTDVSGAVFDDGGQLALDASAVRGGSVTLRFENRNFTAALSLDVMIQLAIALLGVAVAGRTVARLRILRRSTRATP